MMKRSCVVCAHVTPVNEKDGVCTGILIHIPAGVGLFLQFLNTSVYTLSY